MIINALFSVKFVDLTISVQIIAKDYYVGWNKKKNIYLIYIFYSIYIQYF